jgi:shikimate kinase
MTLPPRFRNIILMGMKHCGKTTAGARLAAELDLPFYDLDDLILARQEAAGGGRTTIEEFFRSAGADEFYRAESDAYGSVCGADAPRGFVLAAGGRTPVNPLLEGALEQCGVLVYINTPFDVIYRRIMARGTSALIREDDPEGYLRKLYDERHSVYLRRARLVVDGDGDTAAVVACIRRGLKEA